MGGQARLGNMGQLGAAHNDNIASGDHAFVILAYSPRHVYGMLHT